jgi:hypothetical protein
MEKRNGGENLFSNIKREKEIREMRYFPTQTYKYSFFVKLQKCPCLERAITKIPLT